ncbi:MAG: YbaK/EbsC family protein, partial [Lachnospiraceae bacterium]|nr:YbaK/EbsC family protein [Lachnospiraceae bacterium]
MSFEKAVNYLKQKGYGSRVLVPEESTATVDLAARALGTEPGAIAKTMSLLVDGKPLLILTEGTARIDNHKFKETFHTKAKMIPADQVEELVGHAPGGICPFGIYEGIPVCLDKSIKK